MFAQHPLNHGGPGGFDTRGARVRYASRTRVGHVTICDSRNRMPWPWQLPPISPNPPTSAESPQIPPDPSESRRVSWSNLNEGGDDGGAGHSFAVPYLPHSVEHFSSLAVEHFVFTRRESASRLQNSPLAVPKTKTKRAFWTLITSLLSPSPSPAVARRGGRTQGLATPKPKRNVLVDDGHWSGRAIAVTGEVRIPVGMYLGRSRTGSAAKR